MPRKRKLRASFRSVASRNGSTTSSRSRSRAIRIPSTTGSSSRTTADCTTQMPGGGNYPGDSPQAMCARDHLTLACIQRDFFTNAVYAPDQLRQRVAWALSQIVVTSANEPDLSYAHVMSRFQNIMFQEAFGNYQTLLEQGARYNPAMGNYLDMVNNDRPAGTRVPNENYAREIMQLFSVGLVELNADGTPMLDAAAASRSRRTARQRSRNSRESSPAYTYASAGEPGGPATAKQNRYYGAPMVPYPSHGDGRPRSERQDAAERYGRPCGPDRRSRTSTRPCCNVFMHPNTGVVRRQAADPAPGDRQSVAGVRRAHQRACSPTTARACAATSRRWSRRSSWIRKRAAAPRPRRTSGRSGSRC